MEADNSVGLTGNGKQARFLIVSGDTSDAGSQALNEFFAHVKGGELIAADGRVFLLQFEPTHAAGGTLNGVEVTFTDGFHQMEAPKTSPQSNEVVHGSKQELQQMINALKVGVLTFDYSGHLLHANDAFLEMVGYNREDFVEQGFSWRAFMPTGQPEKDWQILEQVRPAGRGGLYEKECVRKDGSRIWLLFVVADLNDGTIAEYVIDISDRKRVEEDLRRSKEQLRLIIESAKGFAIFTTDATGVVNSWNGGAAEIFEWTEEEIIGQNGAVLFTAEDRAAHQPQIEMETAVREGMAPDIRWHLRKSGRLVFINGFSHPVYDSSGRLNGFVKVGRDITAQHNAETALRESEKNYRLMLEKEVAQQTAELKEINTNLRHANENLRQFASIASHDLQEPLRKINMFTSVLKKNWSRLLPAEGKEVMNKIVSSSDRMSQLIKEVLEFSKIAYGNREFVRTDLHAIMQTVISDLDLLLEETAAVIDYEEPLPAIDAIPLQMHQLFYNLMTNALKFRKSSVPPKVRIGARLLPATEVADYSTLVENIEYIDVTITDNGIGFDTRFSAQIFQIFERLHSTEEYEGTGVGLALCEKIVENHRGYIYAVSKEGEGATFHVILPVGQ